MIPYRMPRPCSVCRSSRIADISADIANGVEDGLHLLLNDVNDANLHMHEVLYGLVKGLIEEMRGQPSTRET